MRPRSWIAALGAGLAVMTAARLAGPLGSPPLYDGVVVQEPYRYLAPGEGERGSPTSYRGSVATQGRSNEPFSAATGESPPQAQLIAGSGAFVVPSGTTSLTASIEPVAPGTQPVDGRIAGNVYRFAVTDASGAQVPTGATNHPSLVLRAPDGVTVATISRLVGGAWLSLPTQAAGQPGIYLTNVDSLGDFALIEPATGPLGLDTRILALAAAAAVAGVAVLLYAFRRSDRRPRPSPSSADRRRPPASKRRRGGRRRGRRR